MSNAPDLAQIRFENAMLLFDEFVHDTIKHPDAATLRGLEGRFAEKVQIQPSYWSQIKGRSRQIGERLARQFEQLCRKPVGWMDLQHGANATGAAAAGRPGSQLAALASTDAATGHTADAPAPAPSQPLDDDERFIVGLVLTYYRRHPQRARTRLLDLLGEVLTPQADAARTLPPAAAAKSGARSPAAAPRAPAPRPPSADDLALFARSQAGVAPLKPKR